MFVFSIVIHIWPPKNLGSMSEFNEFKPRLKSAKKNRFQLSAGLNLETFEYNFKWNQPYLSGDLNLSRRSNSLNSVSCVDPGHQCPGSISFYRIRILDKGTISRILDTLISSTKTHFLKFVFCSRHILRRILIHYLMNRKFFMIFMVKAKKLF